MVDGVWYEARQQLRAVLAEGDFETWIAPLHAATWTGGELTLEVPSTFFRDCLRRNHLAALERALLQATGEPAIVRLVVNRERERHPPRRATPVLPSAGPAAAEPAVAARYTFDTFVVGAANEVAYNAARAVMERPGERFNPLFIFAGPGLGKTHLTFALAHAAAAARHTGTVARLSAEDFVNAMVAALQRRQMDRFRRHFRGIGILVVDDLQFLGDKVRSQEEFVHTFNALHDGRKQIVLTSDRPPHEMPGIEEALRSRLACGLLVDVQPPDPALRLALVERKAAARGLQLAPDVVSYLAERWCANVRVLEGTLTRLDAFRCLSGRPVTLSLVREALTPYAGPPASHATIGRIAGEVCRLFRLTRAELASPRRTARLVEARQVAMYLCRHHTDAPLGAIGAELGGR